MSTPPDSISLERGAAIDAMKIPGDPRQILLIEMLNLLGLFLNHARHAKGARATAVMFDQIIQRLKTINKLPGHDGGLILRRIASKAKTSPGKPDYHILFGDMAFSGSEASINNSKMHKNTGHLSAALEQTFGCFVEQGISALFIQLPGDSPERIDQLRLAFNIIARYHHAVENNASITFRYFGRAMTIPLIKDRQGRPDPNLTLVAGLNSLSATNMRELLKQAEAFNMLSGDPSSEPQTISDYNQVFRVRSLRAQLVRPLVEVNNLPWVSLDGSAQWDLESKDESRFPFGQDRPIGENHAIAEKVQVSEAISPHYLSVYIDQSDRKAADAMEMIFGTEVLECRSREMGQYLGAATKLLQILEEDQVDAVPMGKLMDFLYHRIDRLPEKLLDALNPQRQGLKIAAGGSTILIGMIHPKLLDLLGSIKERVLIQQKLDSVKFLSRNFYLNSTLFIPECFDIAKDEMPIALKMVGFCLESKGKLNRQQFDVCIDQMGALKNHAFELLWCLLRQTKETESMNPLLDALQMLSTRLEDPCRAMGFLMTDLFQLPTMEVDRGRNAFVLINAMLHRSHGEGDRYTDRTPDKVLSFGSVLDISLLRYVARRLAIHRSRVMAKFRSIRGQLLKYRDGSVASHASSLLNFQLWLSLEREGMIFMALAGGETGREIIRDAFGFYSDIQSRFYQKALSSYLPDLIEHFGFILRTIAIIGGKEDIVTLKFIERSAAQWMALDSDSTHIRRVQQILKLVPTAIRHIQVQAN